MIVLYPITYPLAKVLDKVFGEHNVMRFQKNELKALIELHEIKVDDCTIKKDKKVLWSIKINIYKVRVYVGGNIDAHLNNRS